MYVCLCHSVTDRQIRKAVRRGVGSVEELGQELGVATGCGRCLDCACQVIDDEKAAMRRENGRDCAGPPRLLPAGASA